MTSREIAALIDHSVLHPSQTDQDLQEQCHIAAKYKVASVCVKPYHVKLAATLLKDSETKVCAVIGFPHGNNSIAVKVFETLQVCEDGAREVDMVINIGKALQGDWNYLFEEIKAVHDECLNQHAILKVIFENDFMPNDSTKIKLCQVCNEVKVEFVKTSTGFGFVKDAEGKFYCKGATEHDLQLMRRHCNSSIQIKAAGGIRNLDQLLKAVASGASRIGASATEKIIEEAILRFDDKKNTANP
jgi:deoxyribose-phosphate aldolase